MKNQCQLLTEKQRKKLLKLLQKCKELFNGTLGSHKKDPVDFELKEYANPVIFLSDFRNLNKKPEQKPYPFAKNQ